MDQGMTRAQWIAFGAILRQIHAVTLSPSLAQLMPRETFVPVGTGLVRDLDAHIGERTFADPTSEMLATFWRERREEIHTLVARAEVLGQRLARRALAPVLCHADIHTANVLLDADGQVWIVDWDETLLAPKERDLMFVVGAASASGWSAHARRSSFSRATVRRHSIRSRWRITVMPGRWAISARSVRRSSSGRISGRSRGMPRSTYSWACSCPAI